MKYDICFAIAGSDPSGGAGIQADLKTFSALGCYGAAAITAITVQNTSGLRRSIPVEAQIVGEQISAVLEDLRPNVIKIGMVANSDIIHVIRDNIYSFRKIGYGQTTDHGKCTTLHSVSEKPQKTFVVLDPLLRSSSGHELLEPDARKTLIDELMPLCDLITPNLPELQVLTNESDIKKGAHKLMKRTGCANILVKGGHRDGAPTDLLFSGIHEHTYEGCRVQTRNTHGTGCTLSSAIAAYIALGQSLPEAVRRAKKYVSEALSAGRNVTIGQGHGPMNHFFNPNPLVIEENE